MTVCVPVLDSQLDQPTVRGSKERPTRRARIPSDSVYWKEIVFDYSYPEPVLDLLSARLECDKLCICQARES